MCEISPLVLVELAPASTTWDERKEEFSLFFGLKNRLKPSQRRSCTCAQPSLCTSVQLTEEDHDANETEDSSQDQASNTQSVVVCRTKTSENIHAKHSKATNVKPYNSYWENCFQKELITEGKGVVFSCGSRKEGGQQSLITFGPLHQ